MARAAYCIVFLLLALELASASNIPKALMSNVGWWKNTAFYQIYPRSFMDSDGDGIGDLKGITSRLEHFVDAGIGAIWLSPIYPSPNVDYGYYVTNFTGINTDYGTMQDFEALIARAKALKLKVILDLVPNHVSVEHDWFKRSEAKERGYEDFFIWTPRSMNSGAPPGIVPPNNWLSVSGGYAWTYSHQRKEWYCHQFHSKQPDLNYRNPAVRKAMAEVIWFWLEKGVDGFRVDAVPHLFEVDNLRNEPSSNISGASWPSDYEYLDHLYTKDQPEAYELVKSWRDILDAYARIKGTDERILMTEAYTSLDKTVEFYDAGVQVPFNLKFITDVNNKSTPNDFKKIIDTWTTEANKRKGISNWVMGNHDRSRTETRYPDRGDQMTMLAMILPGVSVTYYGEEIGMVDEEKSRYPCRTPFQWDSTANAGFSSNKTGKPWIPVHDNYRTLNLAVQKATPISHYNLFKTLTRLKGTLPALKNGTLRTLVTNSNKALTIVRTDYVNLVANHTVLLVISFTTDETLIVNLASEVPANLAAKGVVQAATLKSPVQQGATLDLTKILLAPKSALVIVADQKKIS